MAIQQAIILAGGFGFRLKSVVTDVPKPMAQVAGKPFLAYLLEHLHKKNFKKVVLSIGYKGEVVQDFFQDDYKGMELVYAIEEDPLGTGGGIFWATQFCSDEPILILNGDTFFDVDPHQLYDFYLQNEADIAFALKHMTNFDRYGTVKLAEQHRIIQFNEKEYCEGGVINGGIYILKKQLFTENGFQLGSRFSFERDLLERYVNQLHFAGLLFNSYFIDIGIPEDYAKAQKDFIHR